MEQFDLFGTLFDAAGEIIKGKAINAGARHTAGLSASAVPPAEVAIQIGLAAWTVADGVSGMFSIFNKGSELLDTKEIIKKSLEQLGNIAATAENNPQAAMANLMSVFANLNGCIRNRRCLLIPYNKTPSQSPYQTYKGNGCCPGQTGHHIMPQSMFVGSNCKPAYYGYNAPTMCLEGINNYHGSHGKAHDFLVHELKDESDKIDYGAAMKYSVAAVRKVAPQCSEKCLKKQLDDYHKGCKNTNALGFEKNHLKPNPGKKVSVNSSNAT